MIIFKENVNKQQRKDEGSTRNSKPKSPRNYSNTKILPLKCHIVAWIGKKICLPPPPSQCSGSDPLNTPLHYIIADIAVWILFQNHPQRYMNRNFFMIIWLSTFFGRLWQGQIIMKKFLFMYLWGWFWNRIETLHILSWLSVKLSQEYLVHSSWIKLASNPCGLDSSTGRRVDQYPKGASSNPAQVNIFQLTLAVSDYNEKQFCRHLKMVNN